MLSTRKEAKEYIKHILSQHFYNNELYFLVFWKDEDRSKSTWEKASDVLTQELIDEYCLELSSNFRQQLSLLILEEFPFAPNQSVYSSKIMASLGKNNNINNSSSLPSPRNQLVNSADSSSSLHQSSGHNTNIVPVSDDNSGSSSSGDNDSDSDSDNDSDSDSDSSSSSDNDDPMNTSTNPSTSTTTGTSTKSTSTSGSSGTSIKDLKKQEKKDNKKIKARASRPDANGDSGSASLISLPKKRGRPPKHFNTNLISPDTIHD
ncbi:hypothetical protein SAMD00019534_070330 [Acytostelium subglobosum LB1]|uniref:hypothetical protein n=1 Tax=Acytostelium subglobosum LB1 TaxID=1410327 RepID=UPI000644D15B|nr:hypothetical protein SAMD00019534_070330 [Acytostelium subglobosum LB1]GAM23858.1 hypothetical protein SAMD00019534_070330 [Acytostelium subglobosum LB1]|eukprot:XP_012752894.1 hypothetical protein SAMD00019534_070330 [Acytostelium subglobosum LB1]